MRLIDADALLESVKVIGESPLPDVRTLKDLEQAIVNTYYAILNEITNAPTVQHEEWVSVEDRLPENDKQVMAWVADKDNKFGGYRELVNYGHYDFYTFDDDHPNADEEGLVSRTGWHYGRESEGEFDYLIFELDGKVTHWQPLPAAPKE